LDKIKPAGGPSPLNKAVAALAGDFKDTQGKIALVIISDGKDQDGAPVAAANGLKAQYGDRLCIYTVLVGDDPAGQKVMGDLSKVTGCGQAVTAEQLATPAQMANFVETVLLEAVAPPKAQMPPKSPRGTWVFKDIKFEFDQATLMESSYPTLETIFAAMRDTPELKVEIQGHTCAMGSDAYNLDLSQRRAQTVLEHLKSKGITAARMTAKGYGESQPMDTNETFEGRANNRRVELKELK
jgi:OOP family OmpA-OmpF porin